MLVHSGFNSSELPVAILHQEEFPVLSPRESLIPSIKAGHHNQRSLWKVLEVLATWNYQRTTRRTNTKDIFYEAER